MLNKLVRDNIPTEMQRVGQKPAVRKLNDAEYKQELIKKLSEEAAELQASDSAGAVKELGDLLEVIEALAAAFGADLEQIQAAQAQRKAKMGGFAKRLYIGRLDLADDDKWVDYYANEPARYPEVKG
ncbi:MAG TPA: nucleoside triphosphate pyrophosphohydrolase [Candidatus Saccharimonadales bacterium]|nr:nucleoside triphosphate pyrophosphohydrolase [Candidatus Saccharimonadales bacterium]